MALRKIVEMGEDCLNKVCRPVTEFNPHLHVLLDDMAETLADANGAGLAAPQVGVLRRVCLVLDEDSGEYIELINPKIITWSGEQTGLEGCLSVPGKWGIVTRPNVVRVRAQDRNGNWFEAQGEGLTARAFCHEIEHLDGHLFVEHIDHVLSDEELREYLEQACFVVKALESGDKLDVRMGALSGGQRQAVALLMATMTPLKFLILDEHTAALDPKTAEVIMALTDRVIREKHLTAMMVTHNLRYAVGYGDRILMMNRGRVVLDRAGAEKRATSMDDILTMFNQISLETGN